MYMDFTSELARLSAYVARFAAVLHAQGIRAGKRSAAARRRPDATWLLTSFNRLECLGRAVEQGDPAEIMDACQALDDQYRNCPMHETARFRCDDQPFSLHEVQQICREIHAKAARALELPRAVRALVAVPQIRDPDAFVTDDEAARLACALRDALLSGALAEPRFVDSPSDIHYRNAPPAWVTAGSLPAADIEVRSAAVDMLLWRARSRRIPLRHAIPRLREVLFLRRGAVRAAARMRQVVASSPLHHAALMRVVFSLPLTSPSRALLTSFVGL